MYNKKDHFHQKAKKDGYLARSAYKLKELQTKFRLLKPNSTILDLGCSPGAWSQVALEILGPQGKILGVDLEQVSLTDPRLEFILGDIFEVKIHEHPLAPFDLVMSDMAPKTSGIKVRDQTRSFELGMHAIELCDTCLKEGGSLVIKIFEGPDLKALAEAIKQRFQRLERIRPDSTRQASTEIYYLGLQKKKS